MAKKNNTNRRAAMAMARDEWDALSKAQRRELIGARPIETQPVCDGAPLTRELNCSRSPTARALDRVGIVSITSEFAGDVRFAPLTLWGLLVREAGLAARAEEQR
jgi:hypothetical protein